MEVENSHTEDDVFDLEFWNANYISDLGVAVSFETQPTFETLRKASEHTSSLVASHLAVPFRQVLPLERFSNPWQYTSELPGIRPIHRSVKAGLVLYQDSISLL